MNSINQVTLVGNLTRDPTTRVTADGKQTAFLSMAMGYSYKDRESGEYVEAADYVSFTLWDKQAEIAEKYLKKGSRVSVTGKIGTKKTENENGVDYSLEFKPRGFVLPPKDSSAPAASSETETQSIEELYESGEFDANDIPF